MSNEIIKFKYYHDGGPHIAEFLMEDLKHNDKRGIFIHVSDLTDHFRIKDILLDIFNTNKIKE